MTETDSGTGKVELSVPSDPRFMSVVRQVASTVAQMAGFSGPEVNSLALAVDEACTNVIKHAYKQNYNQVMTLTCEMHPDRLLFRLRDFGQKTDPALIKGRDLNHVRPGGLGVHFIRQIMDKVEYDIGPEVGTELRMTKFLKPTEPHGSQEARIR